MLFKVCTPQPRGLDDLLPVGTAKGNQHAEELSADKQDTLHHPLSFFSLFIFCTPVYVLCMHQYFSYGLQHCVCLLSK